MTDIEKAKEALGSHSIALCKNGEVITSDKRGVAPLVEIIQSGTDISGFSAADRVVGKAAAMLMLKAGVAKIYALTISESAERLLKSHGVQVSFKNRTTRIMNRDNTGTCPMETAVANTDDINTGTEIIIEKLKNMHKSKPPVQPVVCSTPIRGDYWLDP